LDSKRFLEANYPEAIKHDNNFCIEHFGLDAKKILDYAIINFG
jgi:hypothetical protein